MSVIHMLMLSSPIDYINYKIDVLLIIIENAVICYN